MEPFSKEGGCETAMQQQNLKFITPLGQKKMGNVAS
jgi:hypothetical protein